MATTQDHGMAYASFRIEKTEKTDDGDILIWGKASDGSLDSDEQVVDPAWMEEAVKTWLSTGGNVRVQHNAQRDPAGIGIEAETDSQGATWVKSLIVEPVAKRLVEKGVLRAYSVGIARPRIIRDAVAKNGRIAGGELCEISIVDRPANGSCSFQLVKSADDGALEFTGKMFGASDLLMKSAPDEEVTLPANAVFSPTDLAKLLQHRALAEKRQMDPTVGGGVDRDKLPESDFAGRNRSFPIVTPGDVSDAASSIGRAGEGNYSSDKLKENIIRIARRKGDAFVAELPESWKKELGISSEKGDDMTDVEKGDAPFEGAHEPFGAGHRPVDGHTGHKTMEPDEDGESEAKPDSTKGAKTCLKCNKSFDADSKLRRCPNCNAKLPKADAAMSMKNDGEDVDDDVMCPGCGHEVDDDAKFCAECGHKLDGAMKSSKPTPGDGVVGTGAASVEPVPEHREPDGTDIEELEEDAGLPTVPDASVKAAERVKSIGAPFDLGALHDLTCPAFDRAVVSKSYPNHTLHTIDADEWQQKALDAAANAPLDEAQKMTQLWQNVITLKGAEMGMLDEVRDEAHKAFRDANPGPGTFPTPTELSPVRFRRPLLVAGHETPSPGHDVPNVARVPTNHITAEDFTRGPLTADHAADSPSNKGRAFYRNVQRDAARQAMIALHDHIAQTFPDICTVHENTGGPGTDPNPLPDSVGKSAGVRVEGEVGEKKVKKNKDMITKAAVSADLIKSAVVDALTPLARQVEMLTKALKDEQAKNAKLAETVDELSNLPDPTVTAFKGVASPDALKSSTPVALTVASAAEQTQATLMAVLKSQARDSTDPSEREAAWAKLYQMNGIQ